MKENAWTYTPEEDHWLFSSVQFSSVVQRLKRLPAMWETWVRSLGREDPLEKDMATHSSILTWETPWTEEPGGLHSMGSQRIRFDLATKQQVPAT